MANKTHGITIGMDRVDSHIFLALKVVGKLTHDDYKLITPMIDSAIAAVKTPQVDVLVDCTQLEGWELRAAWDDFKLGLKHGSEFRRIALHGNKKWQEVSAKIASWFASGEVKYFEERGEALAWLKIHS